MFDCITQFLSPVGYLDGFAQFLLTIGLAVLEGLHNFWDQQVTATQNYEFLGATGDYCLEFLNFWIEQLSWDELRNF